MTETMYRMKDYDNLYIKSLHNYLFVSCHVILIFLLSTRLVYVYIEKLNFIEKKLKVTT